MGDTNVERSHATLLARAEEIATRERAALVARTPRTQAGHARARDVLVAGVPANGQAFDPPMIAASAQGAMLVDVDDNAYVDCNMGYGALFVGHAHPSVVTAVREQLDRGSIHVLPSESNTLVAEALAQRWQLPLWRFSASGTEATMAALRAARSITGRARVVKVEGAYHGQYDTILASHKPPVDAAGPHDAPVPVAGSAGIPREMLALVDVVPFNDLDAIERALAAHDVACVIVEPALQNIGFVLPDPGYLAGVRERCDSTGTVLVFDEVKIGITAHWGGATSLYGVTPDVVCVSKSIGGGLPLGAIGGRAEVMNELRPGRVTQVGTFSGNPLSMAAALATLVDVCTPDATGEAIERSTRMAAVLTDVLETHGLPAHVVQLGAKGTISWRAAPVRTYRDTVTAAHPIGHALRLWCANRGVLFPSAGDSQWLLSVQHTDQHVATIVDALATFCDALTH